MDKDFNLSEIGDGERQNIRLNAFELADGSLVSFPLTVIKGVKPGKTLYLGAAIHGDEVLASKAAVEVLGQLDEMKMTGTLLCIPVENPLAMRARTRLTPGDDQEGNMSETFPGKQEGRYTEMLAYHLFNKVMVHADYLISLHCGAPNMHLVCHSMVPPNDSSVASRKALELATVFGLDYIQLSSRGHSFPKSMKNVFTSLGKPAFAAELGDSREFGGDTSKSAIRGVMNVMKHLNMVDGKAELPPKQTVLGEVETIFSFHAGFLRWSVNIGETVHKDQEIARVLNPFGGVAGTIKSSITGVLMGRPYTPLIQPGNRVAMIAKVEGTA